MLLAAIQDSLSPPLGPPIFFRVGYCFFPLLGKLGHSDLPVLEGFRKLYIDVPINF